MPWGSIALMLYSNRGSVLRALLRGCVCRHSFCKQSLHYTHACFVVYVCVHTVMMKLSRNWPTVKPRGRL